MSIFFDDAVTAGNLPTNLTVAPYYADGPFANGSAVKARCPKAKYFGITTQFSYGADANGMEACCADCETYDFTIGQAEAWVSEMVAKGAPLIVVYANLSTWNAGLLSNLAHYGTRIKRWLALYDGVASIPAGFDAKQYASPGPVDLDVMNDTFLTALGSKPAAPANPYPPLKQGDSEPQVKTLQNRLNAWGANPKLVADGAFGPGTAAAVKAFQKEAKLPVTGAIDAADWTKLRAAAPTNSGVAHFLVTVHFTPTGCAWDAAHLPGTAKHAGRVQDYHANLTIPVGEGAPYTASIKGAPAS